MIAGSKGGHRAEKPAAFHVDGISPVSPVADVIQPSTMATPDGQGHYVEGALRLLQFVEARRPTGRRFGPDADSRWASFKGDLETVDRIELMIRDADAEWPGAFGARTAYALPAIAEDETFGASWPGLDPIAAEELWRRLRSIDVPGSPADALAAIAAAWDLTIAPLSLTSVAPTERLVLVGPSAVAAAVGLFAATPGLDWTDQVTVIATPPAHRQIAAAASAILNANRPPPLLDAAGARASGSGAGARLIASPDADPGDRAAADAHHPRAGS
jgi:hypothetical protein